MMTASTIVGIDLGKNWFHLIGLDGQGAAVLRKKLNRRQLAELRTVSGARRLKQTRLRIARDVLL